MESIYTELALYGSKDECARTDTLFYPISEVCDGKVSLAKMYCTIEYFTLHLRLLKAWKVQEHPNLVVEKRQ